MSLPLGKLTIIIGAGLIGSALSKEGRLSDVTGFFSGALKIVTKHLQHDKDNSKSTSKPQTDSLLAQVNNLRQELQILASSRSVTIITGSGSGSGKYGVTVILVVGVVGYGYIWWKGWKLSDMMFVTRRGFSDACNNVGKQLDVVTSSLAVAKRHLTVRIDKVESNIDDCKELTIGTKDEVSQLHGDLSGFHEKVEFVHRAVHTLETKLVHIEGSQDVLTRGLEHLCDFAQRFETNRDSGLLQGSPSTSQQSIELPENTAFTRTSSLPPLALEPPSPVSIIETPKVLRTSTTVSAAGLKELQEITTAIRVNPLKTSLAKASNGVPSVEEPGSSSGTSSSSSSSSTSSSSSSTSNSSRFGWRLPSLSVLTRTRSTAS